MFSLGIVLLNGVFQCSCVTEFVGSKTIVLIQSIYRNRRNTNDTVEIQWKHSIFFVHCYTASISMLFNNCWCFESRMAKISMIRSVLRCTTASTMADQSLILSTTRHPQDVKYKRSTSGALPLASTFKCEFVARTMSLSNCEPLAGAACPPGGRLWWAQ